MVIDKKKMEELHASMVVAVLDKLPKEYWIYAAAGFMGPTHIAIREMLEKINADKEIVKS